MSNNGPIKQLRDGAIKAAIWQNNRAAVRIRPDRFARGTWCHRRERLIGEGDIAAAYSADLIAMEGRVRRPFRLNGWSYVTVGIKGRVSDLSAEAYRLVPIGLFDGTQTTYTDKCALDYGNHARHDPLGFYHGMTVRSGGNNFVLCGPPLTFVPGDDALKQLDLFGDDA